MSTILVIDDDSAFRDGLVETLSDLGHKAVGATGAKQVLSLVKRDDFDLVFIDFQMPEINGVETMRLLQKEIGSGTPPLVMLTAFSDSKNTIEAMRLGAYDHLAKPIGRDDIRRVVDSALRDRRPKEAVRLQGLNDGHQLIGRSEKMRDVFKMMGRLAATETTVLITGETGTGKEVVAQSIHENSARAKAPFVAINCAAIPENLLESELFGHVRGAFTGALNERKGSFELAQGGTLFLDEIGDMNMTLQAKILRAVQEREIVPVGGNKPIRIDCRIIAATHRDLRAMVDRHEFREDLFYRLNVVPLELPPLRERISDLEDLCRAFLSGSSVKLDSSAIGKLKEHSWPGNIRELKNVIERALVLTRGGRISSEEIRLIKNSPDHHFDLAGLDWHQSIAQLERKLLLEALRAANGNRSEAARKLGIQRQLLYSKMKEHQITEA